MPHVQQVVRSYIVDNFLFGQDGQFANDDSFLDKGLIDSVGILTLVEYVCQNYQITVYDEEIIPENWDSVNRIVRFVETKSALQN